jgi:hypothetical protein
MVVTNHRLLKFRTISLVVSFVFATTVYVNVRGFFMFPLFLLQVASLMLAIKLKGWNKEHSLRVISRGGLVFLITVYCLAIAVGVVVSTTTSGVSNSITLLLFYVTCLDALMAIPFVLSFTDKTKWQSAGPAIGPVQGSAMCGGNGQIAPTYAGSDYNATDFDWPQSDYHTTSALDSSPGVNPASGLPMANDAIDVGGNVYGFGDPVFSNDSFHTNQFSDFDYHNNQ